MHGKLNKFFSDAVVETFKFDDNLLTISIDDDGKGFNTATNKNGIGIKNMNSRIQQIKGSLSIDSRINNGTSILITIPI